MLFEEVGAPMIVLSLALRIATSGPVSQMITRVGERTRRRISSELAPSSPPR